MAYSLDSININGANLMFLAELDSTNAVVAALAEGTNCLNLGHLKDSASVQTANKTESKSEDGNTRRTEYTYEIIYSATMMQTNAQVIDFCRNTVKGKRYLIGMKHFARDSGIDSEEFAIVNVSPQGAITKPGADGSNKFEATAIFPDATTAFSSTVLASIETALSIAIVCTAVSITTTAGYDLVETA